MCETLFAAILGAIAGGIIGAISTYYATRSARSTALDAIRITEFNKSAAEFRTAFVDYIYQIRHTENKSNFDIGFDDLRGVHIAIVSTHEKAKIRFEPFISKNDLAGFESAWETYRQWPEHFKKQDDKNDIKTTVLSHIYNLLNYAKPKIN